MASTMNNFFASSHWQKLSNSKDMRTPLTAEDRARRRRQTQEEAALSKQGIWGPTHSYDSSEDTRVKKQQSSRSGSSWFIKTPVARTGSTAKSQTPGSHGTESTKSASSNEEVVPTPSPLSSIWNNAQMAFNCNENDTTISNSQQQSPSPQYLWETIPEVCSPCQPRNLNAHEEDDEDNDITVDEVDASPPRKLQQELQVSQKVAQQQHQQHQPAPLGIARMQAPDHVEKKDLGPIPPPLPPPPPPPRRKPSNDVATISSQSSPAERRRQRYRDRMTRRSGASVASFQEEVEVTPQQVMFKSPRYAPNLKSSSSQRDTSGKHMPVNTLTVRKDDAVNLNRTISELTMRSSYGEATARLSDNRRMAYYAVGRHHRQTGRGGNRRCYFTGKLILGGTPFYAGSVQQGLRTLVVFCLPSALGLPNAGVNRDASFYSQMDQPNHPQQQRKFRGDMSAIGNSSVIGGGRGSLLQRKRSGLSRLSSVDDASYSVMEEEMDANWGLDRDFLLSTLTEPDEDLLRDMARRYPLQFETLPVQVRSSHCWRLYVKFCFFSGLPIAEGELHYKVVTSMEENYGEEIALSHEVMEAVNGDSAEILRLPNLKTFRYLQRHYSQQSAKLPKEIFERQAWEMVRPEV